MATKKNTKANNTVVETVKKPITEIEEITEIEDPRVSEYEVILAKPTYYIVNKDGSNVVINEVNEYKKGDMISL